MLIYWLNGVMFSVSTLNAEGHWFNPRARQTKTLKLVFAGSLPSTQHLGVRAQIDRPRVRIMCLG